MNFDTLAVHAGVRPDPSTGAIMTPIYQTSTYVQAAPGQHQGYEYARTQNPTRDALQTALAALEGAAHCSAFASGMAAVDAILKRLRPGDEVLATNDLYGGTYRIFTQVFAPMGIKFTFVDLTQPEWFAALTPATRLIWVETPTNPLMRVIDIQSVTAVAQAQGIITVVDNTFATPYLQRPLELGADVVLHSATKYLGGHSDVVMGAVMTHHADWHAHLRFVQNACGAVPGPQDCFLMLRGLKTLHLRMARHCENGRAIAAFLAGHPRVSVVHYPGLASHPGHAVAARQMRDFGGMISFALHGDSMPDALRVLSGTRLFALAESLGGVESLIGHPATMTHASIPAEARHRAGLSDTLIRLSVGIEDAQDLIADLAQALG